MDNFVCICHFLRHTSLPPWSRLFCGWCFCFWSFTKHMNQKFAAFLSCFKMERQSSPKHFSFDSGTDAHNFLAFCFRLHSFTREKLCCCFELFQEIIKRFSNKKTGA